MESVFANIKSCSSTALISLEVLDQSMEPEFPVGCVVVIDPSTEAKNGSYVLVENPLGMVMRQLWIRADRKYLKPLNENFHTVRITDTSIIKGVVVQRKGKRRADKKHYG